MKTLTRHSRFDFSSPRLPKSQAQRTVYLSAHEGHPDKICDRVSDAVLDVCLTCDPMCKVACETGVKDNVVRVAGLAEEEKNGVHSKT